MVFSAECNVGIFANTFEYQFTLNFGYDLPEVTGVVNTIRETPTSKILFTTPDTIQAIIKRLPNRVAPREAAIYNTVMKNLPHKKAYSYSSI